LLVASNTITELVSTREKSVVHLDEGKLFVQLGCEFSFYNWTDWLTYISIW
jgi:hypothetical protein